MSPPAPGMRRDPAERELTAAWTELARLLDGFQEERGLNDTQMLAGINRWQQLVLAGMLSRDRELLASLASLAERGIII